MDPIQSLENEHRIALGELEKLEAAARALDERPKGEEADASFAAARAAYDFLTSAVREHNEKEERALFPLLGGEAPTEPFVEEHVALRSMERRLRDAIERRDGSGVAAASRAIVDALRDHIHREDKVLFPMAREILGPEGLLEVGRRLTPTVGD